MGVIPTPQFVFQYHTCNLTFYSVNRRGWGVAKISLEIFYPTSRGRITARLFAFHANILPLCDKKKTFEFRDNIRYF